MNSLFFLDPMKISIFGNIKIIINKFTIKSFQIISFQPPLFDFCFHFVTIDITLKKERITKHVPYQLLSNIKILIVLHKADDT